MLEINKFEELKEFDNHELLSFIYDEESGLKGYLAIHNMNLGPSVGGTRMYQYASDTEAIRDALRISRTMTYKCALSGLKYGGGKGVIIGDPETVKNEALLRAYGRKINLLCGFFLTGTDVGINEADLQVIAQESEHVMGLPQKGVDKYETPKIAAVGVYQAMLGALEKKKGSKSLDGKTVAIKGVGSVGGELLRLVYEDNAKVLIGDTDEKAVKKITDRFPRVEVVDPLTIHKQKVEIYAPCALSEEFTAETVQDVRAEIIVGSANNQLSSRKIGDIMYAMGIMYTPDYVVNAGGLINVVDDYERYGYSKKRVLQRVQKIRKTLLRILDRSALEKRAPHRVADTMAEEIIYG